MIRDFVTVLWAECDFPDCHVPREHLVEVPTLAMSLNAWVKSRVETEWSQLLNDVSHVVVKVTTYDYRSSGVLPDDVSGVLYHPFSSFFQVMLFSRLEIAVKNLNVLVDELKLGPTEIGSKCLH